MEIDRKTLKALAADTRLDILKSLGKRRKMPSELSKELNLANSTIIEHLTKLEEADLVRREETGHKWIYYALTQKGESLVKPRYPVNVIIVLSITVLIIFAASFITYNNYTNLGAVPSTFTTTTEQTKSNLPQAASGITQNITQAGTTGAMTQNIINFTFNSGIGNCNSGKQIEIIGEDNKITFSGSIGTPDPCYKLEGTYSKTGSNIEIKITSKSIGEICIQCAGSVDFDGYLEISEGLYNIKLMYNEQNIAEKDVTVL